MKTGRWTAVFALFMMAGAGCCMATPSMADMAEAPVKQGGSMAQFPKPFPKSFKQISQTDSNFDHKKEKFYIYVPSTYTGREPYGLIVYIDPGHGRNSLPGAWDAVLDRNKFIFIAPQNVGNDQKSNRRNGMAVTAALAMLKYYNIDRNRVYAAGLSGGARIACGIAFHAPELFKGTIQSCGTDFFKAVPKVAVTAADTAAHPEGYGVAPISPAEAAMACSRVKFVMITGPKDFRYHFIQDIYNGGFKPAHYKATLLDIPNMGHEVCNGDALQTALTFLGQP